MKATSEVTKVEPFSDKQEIPYYLCKFGFDGVVAKARLCTPHSRKQMFFLRLSNESCQPEGMTAAKINRTQ
jgi:hypothetical protein